MKIMLLFILIIFSACASEVPLRAFNDRIYYPCETWETENPAGKFCYRYCVKWRVFRDHISENCKQFETDIQDLTDPVVFEKFRAAGFKLTR